jgi:choline/glycine/proline betaine transport protein
VEGLSAALLLLAGGLGALQAATLVAALPFTIIMILLAFGLVRQMNADRSGIPVEQAAAPLRERLKRILSPARRKDIERQIERHGMPALQAVRQALEAEGVADVAVARDADGVRLSAAIGSAPFNYSLAATARALPAFTALEAPEPRRSKEWRLIAHVDRADRDRDVTGFTTDQLIADVLTRLDQQRRNLKGD